MHFESAAGQAAKHAIKGQFLARDFLKLGFHTRFLTILPCNFMQQQLVLERGPKLQPGKHAAQMGRRARVVLS